jgi:hypothetical protein
MYFIQLRFRKKVAGTKENIGDMQDLPHSPRGNDLRDGQKSPGDPAWERPSPEWRFAVRQSGDWLSRISAKQFAAAFAFWLKSAYNGRFHATPR